MKEYRRDYPAFALCGLNCGLCPRFHTTGASRCPGCGGPGFHLQHPTCAVVTCARSHGVAEFCFECPEYPCDRYTRPNVRDSFISYRHAGADLARAAGDLEAYRRDLDEKVALLRVILRDFDDGRRKGFYCLAVNLLPLEDVRTIVEEARRAGSGRAETPREKAERVVESFRARAKKAGIELALRK